MRRVGITYYVAGNVDVLMDVPDCVSDTALYYALQDQGSALHEAVTDKAVDLAAHVSDVALDGVWDCSACGGVDFELDDDLLALLCDAGLTVPKTP